MVITSTILYIVANKWFSRNSNQFWYTIPTRGTVSRIFTGKIIVWFLVWRCGRDCRKGTVGINMTRVFGRADYFCNIAPRKFTYIACKDDILVVSIPRRMLLKIARTPRTELYKSVITKRCDHILYNSFSGYMLV